jgi:transcriptional regulator with XRE-family HTH domain
MEELGEFLRSRRDRLRPQDIGVHPHGLRRRVPGLRREELAQLAGVSVAYYTRLEQGQNANASDAVLEALARALRLDDDERAHLYRLSRSARKPAKKSRPERLRPATQQTINAIEDLPAYVVGRSLDVLAWNRPARSLLAGHLDADAPQRTDVRPNMGRLVFVDLHTRDLYVDWAEKARETVAYLRAASSRYPDDPALASLIGELSMKSPQFATLWAKHPVAECGSGPRRFDHPVVGELTLTQQITTLSDDPGQRLVILSAQPGSASQDALDLLVTTRHRQLVPIPLTPSRRRTSGSASYPSPITRQLLIHKS